jgi:hypothetical protein
VTAVGDAWTALRQEARQENGWHLRRVHPAASCEILAGLHQPGTIPGLLLEVPVSDVPADLVLPQSKGFTVEPVLLGGSASGRVRFALMLSDRAYEPVFAVLCEDTAAIAAHSPAPRTALREWTGRLHVWQEFMARHGAAGLSEAAVLGLTGELIALRDHLSPLIGIRAAVDMWSGPVREPNDFALPGGFLEIKATSRQAPELIEIANADQLDDSRGQILLAHVRLRPDPSGTTLPELVSEIRSLIVHEAGDRAAALDHLLMAAGYVDAQADLYTRAFTWERTDFFRVDGDFPRIRRSDLRPGIRSSSYAIELRACAPYAAPSALAPMVGAPELG